MSRPSLRSFVFLALVLCVVPAFGQGLGLIGTYDSGLGEGATEIVAHDAASQRLFIVNSANSTVDVVDISTPSAPAFIASLDVTTFGAAANSVAVSNGIVAVAVEADTAQDPGQVVFFSTSGAVLGAVTVGALPDMLTFTPDGTRVLVANEGEPNDDYTVDPEGSVSIIDISGGLTNPAVTTVGFTDFNAGGSRAEELSADVRVFGPGASVAQDLEPEFITVSDDGSTAWVALQEANAFAVIDVNAGTVIRIDALGFKDHSLPGNTMDASNRDDGINIQNWPTLGMYQPDGITSLTLGMDTYVFSANEGDSRDYDGFSEEERIADVMLDPTAFPDAATLQDDANLGRLKITTANGDTDTDGDFDTLYSYGARSFSVWNGSDGSLVWDSGDQFETITAAQVPAIFNSDQGDPDEFDDRSDDKGPEPEGVVVGQVGDAYWAFINLERIGGVMVYDVTDPTSPQFAFYEPSAPGDLAPEGIVFIPAADSPTGNPLLVLANEDSGTVAIYTVSGTGTGAGSCVSSGTTLCLQNNRFAVEATWSTPEDNDTARAQTFTDESGYFWFFNERNIEITVKVIDACADPFDRFWVFAAGMTTVEAELTVTDTVSGEVRTYTNDLGDAFQPVIDLDAFETCP